MAWKEWGVAEQIMSVGRAMFSFNFGVKLQRYRVKIIKNRKLSASKIDMQSATSKISAVWGGMQ